MEHFLLNGICMPLPFKSTFLKIPVPRPGWLNFHFIVAFLKPK
jgi:hypothetical protein